MDNIILEINEIKRYVRNFSYNRFITISNKIIRRQNRRLNTNSAHRLPQISKRRMNLQFI